MTIVSNVVVKRFDGDYFACHQGVFTSGEHERAVYIENPTQLRLPPWPAGQYQVEFWHEQKRSTLSDCRLERVGELFTFIRRLREPLPGGRGVASRTPSARGLT